MSWIHKILSRRPVIEAFLNRSSKIDTVSKLHSHRVNSTWLIHYHQNKSFIMNSKWACCLLVPTKSSKQSWFHILHQSWIFTKQSHLMRNLLVPTLVSSHTNPKQELISAHTSSKQWASCSSCSCCCFFKFLIFPSWHFNKEERPAGSAAAYLLTTRVGRLFH